MTSSLNAPCRTSVPWDKRALSPPLKTLEKVALTHPEVPTEPPSAVTSLLPFIFFSSSTFHLQHVTDVTYALNLKGLWGATLLGLTFASYLASLRDGSCLSCYQWRCWVHTGGPELMPTIPAFLPAAFCFLSYISSFPPCAPEPCRHCLDQAQDRVIWKSWQSSFLTCLLNSLEWFITALLTSHVWTTAGEVHIQIEKWLCTSWKEVGGLRCSSVSRLPT